MNKHKSIFLYTNILGLVFTTGCTGSRYMNNINTNKDLNTKASKQDPSQSSRLRSNPIRSFSSVKFAAKNQFSVSSNTGIKATHLSTDSIDSAFASPQTERCSTPVSTPTFSCKNTNTAHCDRPYSESAMFRGSSEMNFDYDILLQKIQIVYLKLQALENKAELHDSYLSSNVNDDIRTISDNLTDYLASSLDHLDKISMSASISAMLQDRIKKFELEIDTIDDIITDRNNLECDINEQEIYLVETKENIDKLSSQLSDMKSDYYERKNVMESFRKKYVANQEHLSRSFRGLQEDYKNLLLKIEVQILSRR